MEALIPRRLVKYIANVTGIDEETVARVLQAERMYYLSEVFGKEE